MKNKILEVLLYYQGDEGLNLEQVKEIFGLNNQAEAKKVMEDFLREYNKLEQGLKVVNFNDIYKLATRETYKEWITKMVTVAKKQRLSQAALEVVGIVAYKQPVTRSQITKYRGNIVSDHIVSTLITKGIIEEVGVSPTPGSPILYGVTAKFYDHFKLTSMQELPSLRDFSHLDQSDGDTEDFDLYSSQRQE
ncbi:SMC-Scp complex subunit ScpB [Mycoplasma nasistruthionis]|uniref:Segregation/condensation protein B n=1 Tax=Mycoplasma nasistruthionis TaxID=353852 RepID=A0A4Y6I6Y4_9MOLU|nr:SMC-Scp complex subunit ScpB [Mycoplasma nasistruthionis]QDF64959.1 segregation/condensation protein B [Mycoplasma nasistruthionis]